MKNEEKEERVSGDNKAIFMCVDARRRKSWRGRVRSALMTQRIKEKCRVGGDCKMARTKPTEG